MCQHRAAGILRLLRTLLLFHPLPRAIYQPTVVFDQVQVLLPAPAIIRFKYVKPAFPHTSQTTADRIFHPAAKLRTSGRFASHMVFQRRRPWTQRNHSTTLELYPVRVSLQKCRDVLLITEKQPVQGQSNFLRSLARGT